MKNQQKSVFYYIACFCLIVCIIFELFNVLSTKSSEQIFDKSLYSVVEIKATKDGVGESFGTAVFVNKDGTLVTNAHVATYKELEETKTFDSYMIRFAFEEEYHSVTLIKYNTELDIAVLKLDNLNCKFKAIPLGNSKTCKAGNTVYAIGNLNNVGISLTSGIISNPSINVEYNETIRNVIQCNITIAEGNSGGALVDQNGKLIGITTFRLKDNSNNVIYGIAYCVPTHTVLEYIK